MHIRVLTALAVLCAAAPAAAQAPDWAALEKEATRTLQQYIRIDTSNPPGDVRKAADLLLSVHADPARFRSNVSTAMTDAPRTLPPSASLVELEAVLDEGLVAIIADDNGFHGLITRFDLLNHLRRTLS